MRPDKKPRSSPVYNPAGAVNQFRKYAKYIVLTVMFGMLIISFGLWGIGDMLRSGGSSTEIAHVGGTHIPIYGWVGGSSVTANQGRDQFNPHLDNIQRQTGHRPGPPQPPPFPLHPRTPHQRPHRPPRAHPLPHS